jgi:hypothetical protein
MVRRRSCHVGWAGLCEVGVIEPPAERVDGVYPWNWPERVIGSGPSWVQAFADADRKTGATIAGIP